MAPKDVGLSFLSFPATGRLRRLNTTVDGRLWDAALLPPPPATERRPTQHRPRNGRANLAHCSLRGQPMRHQHVAHFRTCGRHRWSAWVQHSVWLCQEVLHGRKAQAVRRRWDARQRFEVHRGVHALHGLLQIRANAKPNGEHRGGQRGQAHRHGPGDTRSGTRVSLLPRCRVGHRQWR